MWWREGSFLNHLSLHYAMCSNVCSSMSLLPEFCLSFVVPLTHRTESRSMTKFLDFIHLALSETAHWQSVEIIRRLTKAQLTEVYGGAIKFLTNISLIEFPMHSQNYPQAHLLIQPTILISRIFFFWRKHKSHADRNSDSNYHRDKR